MNLYRNNKNKKLYTIERLVLDIKFCNRNARAGIYAEPYKHNNTLEKFLSKSKSDCMSYVDCNFELISEI